MGARFLRAEDGDSHLAADGQVRIETHPDDVGALVWKPTRSGCSFTARRQHELATSI
jgi:hypothetical protein